MSALTRIIDARESQRLEIWKQKFEYLKLATSYNIFHACWNGSFIDWYIDKASRLLWCTIHSVLNYLDELLRNSMFLQRDSFSASIATVLQSLLIASYMYSYIFTFNGIGNNKVAFAAHFVYVVLMTSTRNTMQQRI